MGVCSVKLDHYLCGQVLFSVSLQLYKCKISPYGLRQQKIEFSSLEEIFGTFRCVDTSTVALVL